MARPPKGDRGATGSRRFRAVFGSLLTTLSLAAVAARAMAQQVPPTDAPPAPPERCSVTQLGTDAREELVGTAQSDFISGRDGGDRLKGLEAPDRLDGGPGRDVLVGGLGQRPPEGQRRPRRGDRARREVRPGGMWTAARCARVDFRDRAARAASRARARCSRAAQVDGPRQPPGTRPSPASARSRRTPATSHPPGSDSNPGTREAPLEDARARRSRRRAGRHVRAAARHLRRHRHDPAMSRPGTASAPITFRGDPAGRCPGSSATSRSSASHQRFNYLLFDGPTGQVKPLDPTTPRASRSR